MATQTLSTPGRRSVSGASTPYALVDESGTANATTSEAHPALAATQGAAVLGWTLTNSTPEPINVNGYDGKTIWFYAAQSFHAPAAPPATHPGAGWRFLGPGDTWVCDEPAVSLWVVADAAASANGATPHLPYALFVRRSTAST